MMSSVFSSFDPTLSVMGVSLFMIFFFLLFLPLMYWSVGGLVVFLVLGFKEFIFKESKNLVEVKKGVSMFMILTMIGLLVMNFFALFPFLFSLTSHLMLNFPLSYSMWVGVVMFGLFNYFKGFLIHLTPLSTPLGLLSFMIIIEFVSNLIRPLALMFRLTANMMAGHLLLSLVGGFLMSFSFMFTFLGMFAQSLLVLMELGVSLVQAYVFSTLLMLYISEISD